MILENYMWPKDRQYLQIKMEAYQVIDCEIISRPG